MNSNREKIRLSEFRPDAYRWTIEEIIGRIWPFSKYRLPYNFLLLFLGYSSVGIYFVLVHKPNGTVIVNGILVTASIVVGSIILVWYAHRMRNIEIILTPQSSRLEMSYARHFRNMLELHFSDVSIFPGVVIFTFVVAFLFTEPNIFLKQILGGMNDFKLLIFDFILLWDISYRLGVGLWSPCIMLFDTLRLKKVAKSSSSPPLYAKSVKDIRTLALSNSLFVLPACFLIPIATPFPLLIKALYVYILVILGSSGLSAFLLRSQVVKEVPTIKES